jgi:hypothetical protein
VSKYNRGRAIFGKDGIGSGYNGFRSGLKFDQARTTREKNEAVNEAFGFATTTLGLSGLELPPPN